MTANLAGLIREKAARHPDRPAIIQYRSREARRLTFAELERRVVTLAARMRDAGIGPGDRVLLFVPMSIELYVTLLAALYAGAAAVFVDAWADRERLDAAVAAARPKAFIGSPRAQLLRLLSPAVRRIPVRWTAHPGFFRSLEGGESSFPPAAVTPDAPALITFTTGSTGAPKAAARSHAFLWAQHRAVAGYLRLDETDVDMPTLPVFVLNNLALGVPSVLPEFDPRRPAEIDPAAIYRQMKSAGVTTTSGSPAFFERLAGWCARNGLKLPVRALFTGGAPVFPALARLLRETTAGEAHVVYGSTEAEPISGIRVEELLEALASDRHPSGGICVGRPVDGLSLRLTRPCEDPIRLDGRGWEAWEVPPGEAGEIVVAGEHVLGHYLDNPDADRRQKIADGGRVWHRTGDGGRLDAQGRLWLLGRLDQRVRREGETWWSLPAEIRALSVPGVIRAAYLPAAGTGRALLCVETSGGRLSDEERQALAAALAPFPVDSVHPFRRLPRDPRHASKNDVPAIYRRLARRS